MIHLYNITAPDVALPPLKAQVVAHSKLPVPRMGTSGSMTQPDADTGAGVTNGTGSVTDAGTTRASSEGPDWRQHTDSPQ